MNNVVLLYAWLRRNFRILFWWLILVILSLAALAAFQHSRYLSELKSESTRLFRIASQRVGQHEAYMTALAAVIDSGVTQHQGIFLNIATTINRFYPRIEEIQLIQLKDGRQLIGTQSLDAHVASVVSAATKKAMGMFTLLPHPTQKARYILIKRRPNSNAALYALTLVIDAKQLLSSATQFWSRENVTVRLTLPKGAVLIGPDEIGTAHFSQVLDSYTQPLHLDISIDLGIADLLQPRNVIGTILVVSLLYLVVLLILWQRRRTREAEQLAKLREIETQLTHASRVNAMGEMASGMAHELTQPLTAILAQSQAGARLLGQGKIDELEPIFHDTVIQSRRASSILERLRNWSRPQREDAVPIDLSDALHNVHKLLASEARQRGVQVTLHLPQQSAFILANQVEMEQVIYNLVRNGFEALESAESAQVDVFLKVSNKQVILDISDNGQGVPTDIIPQLFTPFYTTRENGTGLGLTLSQRLVERADGEISYVESRFGATFRVVLPLAADHCGTVPMEAMQ